MLKVSQVEPTPNPNALKFIVNEKLSISGVKQFDNPKSGEKDPLASALFGIEGVDSVFYADQFVTVSKDSSVSWRNIQSQVVQKIESSDAPTLGQENDKSPGKTAKNSDDLLDQINKVIEQNVAPALAGDGGGLEVLGIDGYVVTVHYQGACGSCPSAAQGTMMAIQNLLRATVDPKIQVVSDQY